MNPAKRQRVLANKPAARWLVIPGTIVGESSLGIKVTCSVPNWIRCSTPWGCLLAERVVNVTADSRTCSVSQGGDRTQPVGVVVAGCSAAQHRKRLVNPWAHRVGDPLGPMVAELERDDIRDEEWRGLQKATGHYFRRQPRAGLPSSAHTFNCNRKRCHMIPRAETGVRVTSVRTYSRR